MPTHPDSIRTGPISDPENRRARAKLARSAQSTPEYHAQQIVAAWPELSEQRKSRLAALLSPVTRHAGGGHGGR